MFRLRFNKKSISKWAGQYPVQHDMEMEILIAPQASQRGYLLKPELEKLCYWKTPRSKRRVAGNPADYVEAVTRTALSTPNERLRIEVLLLLDGVSFPTASVILHFCHTDPYPILDFRALWSLGMDANSVPYNFELWKKYALFCRQLAQDAGVSMRELDRALWQYSASNQR